MTFLNSDIFFNIYDLVEFRYNIFNIYDLVEFRYNIFSIYDLFEFEYNIFNIYELVEFRYNIFNICNIWGVRIAQWWSVRLVIEMSQVQIPAGAAELFSPGSAFCADSYCGIRSIPALLQSRIKEPGHSAKECWWQTGYS